MSDFLQNSEKSVDEIEGDEDFFINLRKMKKTLIVILADDSMLTQALHVVRSISIFGNIQSQIMIISDNLSKENTKILTSKGLLVKIFPSLSHYNSTEYPDIVLIKLYLFTIYFKQWDRILYLDADTSVRCSLNPLFNFHGFNAVYDCGFFQLSSQFISLSEREKSSKLSSKYNDLVRNYDLTKKVFNVGVFAFDTSIIRPKTFDELKKLLNDIKEIVILPEQALFNLYFGQIIRLMPLFYNNYMPTMKHVSTLKRDVCQNFGILHFIGRNKQYNMSSHYKKYYYDLMTLDSDDVLFRYGISEDILSNLKKYHTFLMVVNKTIVKHRVYTSQFDFLQFLNSK